MGQTVTIQGDFSGVKVSATDPKLYKAGDAAVLTDSEFANLLAGPGTRLITPTTAAVACTFTDSGDVVNAASHGLLAGDAVVFATVVTSTGLTVGTVYYVRTAGLAAGTFTVSTVGAAGAAVAITTDGSGTYRKVGTAIADPTRATINNRDFFS